mgnify:FL=1|jgi:hypothetical protein
MIGEMMCHLTGFLAPLPYDLIFTLIGLIWFAAGWLISSRRQNQRWLNALQLLDESDQKKVIHHAHSKRKRAGAFTPAERIRSLSRRLLRRG